MCSKASMTEQPATAWSASSSISSSSKSPSPHLMACLLHTGLQVDSWKSRSSQLGTPR